MKDVSKGKSFAAVFGVCVGVFLGIGCGKTDGPNPTVEKPFDPPSTYDCRPVDHVWDPTIESVLLPCEPTTEPCDGIDNDADGVIDPHCPSRVCTSDGDCTADGVVPDAICRVDPTRGDGVVGGCAPIDEVPDTFGHQLCWGKLCPPGRKCVEGDCVWAEAAKPEEQCGSGTECPLNAGCVRGEKWIKTETYEIGECRQYCHEYPCPVGTVCMTEVGVGGIETASCSKDFVCFAVQESNECVLEIFQCNEDPGCRSVFDCVADTYATVVRGAPNDAEPSPSEVTTLPISELLGVPGAQANACWDGVKSNKEAGELKACLEFVCTYCLDCTNKECGPDGCGGSCGVCVDGKECSDDIQSQDVGSFPKGTCVCLPNCLDKDCGSDGCGGSCGDCSGGTECTADGLCLCSPSCEGKQCGVDGCGLSCGTCEPGLTCMEDGACQCAPDCESKDCGPDGCGGECGTCDQAGSTCSLAGICICLPTCAGKECGVDGCGNSCGTCPENQGCSDSGECGCFPACGDKVCGVDGCGNSCGTCPGNEVCNEEGVCGCFPICGTKECGLDGCGNSCGACADGEVCSEDGICECIPNCDGKVCGVDGCDGICGVCGDNEQCTANKQCVCLDGCGEQQCGEDVCGNSCGTCPIGALCTGAGMCECVADCTNKECGPDGCGLSCGDCATGETCNALGKCAEPKGSCAGLCDLPSEGQNCKCDSSCFDFSDCCNDICAACATEFAAQCGG